MALALGMTNVCHATVAAPVFRALLVACDEFITHPGMSPTGLTNINAIQTVLENDTRGFKISTQYGITNSKDALQAAIDAAFMGATDEDVSYLYISTHGAIKDNGDSIEGELIFSDGWLEERIGASALRDMLANVRGTIVLIVDACYSGALTGKGASFGEVPFASVIGGDRFKTLVSSGASEPSWYWLGGTDGPPLGSSYFTNALAQSVGLYGEYTADADRNGEVTLAEAANNLRRTCAASTAQASPQDDGFVLFQYDAAKSRETDKLSGFVFERTVLNADKHTIEFSYTVSGDTRVSYQIVSMRDGFWDWQRQSMWNDSESEDGTVTPGRKSRSIDITGVTQTDSGYVMLNVVEIDERGEPIIKASRVISIQPTRGDPRLDVVVPSRLSIGGDLAIYVNHDFPCPITLSVTNSEDVVVKWLSVAYPTRPQGLTPSGSLYYWNFRNSAGVVVEPGEYTITAATKIGGETYTARAVMWVGE